MPETTHRAAPIKCNQLRWRWVMKNGGPGGEKDLTWKHPWIYAEHFLLKLLDRGGGDGVRIKLSQIPKLSNFLLSLGQKLIISQVFVGKWGGKATLV